MTGRATWPAHLRDDAPSQQCGRCGRYTWSPSEFGAECRMPQPDGYPCGGRFEPPGILLDIYNARVGEPVPTDATTPLHQAYVQAGTGRMRLTRPEPHDIGDLIVRTVVGNPQMLIAWEERRTIWHAPNSAQQALPMTTIVGQTVTEDGWAVRMVAHRAGRFEDELHGDLIRTTIGLYRDEPSGGVVTWYYRKTRPAAGDTWRGIVHGGLLKVTEVDEDWVHCLVVYAGNPYLVQEVGSVIRLSRSRWPEFMEYAPEWNDRSSRPRGA